METQQSTHAKTAEIHQFNLHFEGYRIRNKLQEKEVQESVRLNGILEPLEVILKADQLYLLNGFKRFRAAKKLGLQIIPWVQIGEDEIGGITNLIRQSQTKRLNILEEAKFLATLSNKKSLSELAVLVDKSIGWVSMRLQLIKDLDAQIEQRLFTGAFPVYAYMYFLRPFIRMKGVSNSEILEVVSLLSGKNLSIRQIEYLIEAWFHGSEPLKAQLKSGKVRQVLKQIQQLAKEDVGGCTESESRMLRMLESMLAYMHQFQLACENKKLKSNSYRCQANYLTNAILTNHTVYIERMKVYHDYLGQTSVDLSTASAGT